MAFRNTRSRAAGTDYQYHLKSRINEVMSLKKAVGALSESRRSLMRDNETLEARNQELHAEVEALSETNAELSRRMEMYSKYAMAMAARHPRAFEEFTLANPEYCVLGPYESDV